MTIVPILKIERQKWGALGIIEVIGDGIFLRKCKVFSDITKTTTSHAFVYDSHISKKRNEWMLWCDHWQ